MDRNTTAVRCHLKLDGIPGDCKDAGHEDEIVVLSWSWATNNRGGPDQGKDLFVWAPTGRATPLLMLACATGQQHPEARLVCYWESGGGPAVLTIRLGEVWVTSCQFGGNDASLMDQVYLGFARIEMEYRVGSATATELQPVAAGYDMRHGEVIPRPERAGSAEGGERAIR